MNEMHFAEAPSNIALIKYMGKIKGADANKPANSSLSMTLGHLRSRVEITPSTDSYDSWEPLDKQGWTVTKLSERGRKRYMTHFEFLKQKLGVHGNYIVKSANNFPSDCGIASSASSFAALTMVTYKIAQLQNKKIDINIQKLADLSRAGSGSSIRSFLSPLVVWNGEGVSTISIPYNNLLHQVVIVDRSKKEIGSSDAHQRVPSSLLYQGRVLRAEARLVQLLNAFENKNWKSAFEIVWAEFWDMHALFATANPPFHYMSDKSLKILDFAFQYWQKNNDGPLITMDAGANVHLIYREDQIEIASQLKQNLSNQIENIEILNSYDSQGTK
jgi:diphosphomevalonate decarboxylase